MEENRSPDMDILAGLRNALGVECDKCGEVNSLNSTRCKFCGANIKAAEEDEESMSFVHIEGIPGAVSPAASGSALRKVPLEKAGNLIALRNAASGIRSGQINLNDYRATVSKVLVVAQTGANLFKTDVLKNKIDALPSEQRNLASRTGSLFDQYQQGCQKMLQYDGSNNFGPVTEGLAAVESALEEMDRIQDRAIEIAEQLRTENPV